MAQTKNDSGTKRRAYVYKTISIINECRGHGEFGRGQYSARECDFEFPDDGSVIVMMKSTTSAAKRKFVRYTQGQWFGEGEASEG